MHYNPASHIRQVADLQSNDIVSFRIIGLDLDVPNCKQNKYYLDKVVSQFKCKSGRHLCDHIKAISNSYNALF